MRTIQYAVEKDSGIVISRVGSEICVPVLQFGDMKPENNWRMIYIPEKMPLSALRGCWDLYKWTRKIPIEIKNQHRKFWGMKPIKERIK